MIPYYPDNNITIYNYHRQGMDRVQMKRTESKGHFRGGPFATGGGGGGGAMGLCFFFVIKFSPDSKLNNTFS